MTVFDLVILLAIAASAGLGYLRGLSREAITLFSLGAAVLLAVWLGAWLAAQIGETFASAIIAYLVLFVVGFLAATTALELLAGTILGREPTRADRIAGAVFGAIRGWLLMGLVYLASTYYFDEQDPPDTIDGALLKGVVAAAASLLEDLGIEESDGDRTTGTEGAGVPRP